MCVNMANHSSCYFAVGIYYQQRNYIRSMVVQPVPHGTACYRRTVLYRYVDNAVPGIQHNQGFLTHGKERSHLQTSYRCF